MVANALLTLRSGWASRETPITVLAFALLVAAGAAILYGAWRRQHLLNGYGRTAPTALAIVSAAVVTLVASGTGIASIVMR